VQACLTPIFDIGNGPNPQYQIAICDATRNEKRRPISGAAFSFTCLALALGPHRVPWAFSASSSE
jgi:hypothetical protein